MHRKLVVFLGAALALILPFFPAGAAPGEISFIAPTNHIMPFARFEHGELRGGMIKDMGEAIAARLGLRVRFVSTPSLRVASALARGDADGVCYVLPRWIKGDFNWSAPFIPNTGVIIANRDAPVIRQLGDLADQPVGVVLGYGYPQIESALGAHFVQEVAPSMELNLRKLAVGRMRYAITEEVTFAYQMHLQPALPLRVDLPFTSFNASCAFSHQSKLPFETVDQAIRALIDDGTMKAIFARYR